MKTGKYYILIIILFCGLLKGNAQTTEDLGIVKQIYDELKLAIGDQRTDWPVIGILEARDQIAKFQHGENQDIISVDQPALDVCKTLGEHYQAAVAFIIGHEMTHFYQDHEWKESGFASNFIMSVEDFAERKGQERQADIYGAFIARQAGYDIYPFIETLLTALYEDYGFGYEENRRYHSFEERVFLAKESCSVVEDLYNIFQTANYLYLSGNYEEALRLYEYINNIIKFKELFLNMATSSLAQLLEREGDELFYPLEISGHLPLRRGKTSYSNQQLRQIALLSTESAIQLDPQYFPASLNRVLALALTGQTGSAQSLLEQFGDRTLTTKELARLHLLKGNLSFREGDRQRALESYGRVSNNTPDLQGHARTNIRIVKGKPVRHFSNKLVKRLTGKIGDINLRTFDNFERVVELSGGVRLHLHEALGSVLSWFDVNGIQVRVQKVYTGAVRHQGIQIGQPRQMTEENLSAEFTQIVEYGHGYYLFDAEKGFVLKFNANDTLVEWGRVIRIR